MLQVRSQSFPKGTFHMHYGKIPQLRNVRSGPIHPIRYRAQSHILKEYIELFEMSVGVLTTCHTQYT